MWRNSNNQSQAIKTQISINRWRLIVAIVFLFAGVLIYRLFTLQITRNHIYTVMATNQQRFFSRLAPKRGNIYFTANVNGKEILYPAATNREFAVLYAVPKDIKNPQVLAKKFYEFFDEPKLKAALMASIASSTPATSTPAITSIATSTRQKLIAGYLKHFNRPEAVYDSLSNKELDDEGILKLYAFLASSTSTPISVHSLKLKDNFIVYKRSSSSASVVLNIPGIGFHLEQRRYYPENSIGAHVLGFTSYVNGIGQGHYGLEGFFNSELSGKYGSIRSDRGAKDGVIIADERKYVKPINGDDLILTINRNVESMVCAKLKQGIKKYQATGGSVIAVSPHTGAIIAMCSFPTFNPNDYRDVSNISVYNNPALLYQYEPGSVFKAMTLSAAINEGKITPNTVYHDAGEILIPGWPTPIRNSDYFTHGGHGTTTMTTVLDYSLNTGAIFVMRQIGQKVFTKYVEKYGFGQKTGIELGAESPGDISSLLQKKVPQIDAATASFGQGIAVTPLQMVMSYQAIANGGVLMKPYVVEAIVHNGKRENTMPQEVRRVITPKTADTISGMLVNVLDFGRGKKGFIPGYYIGGKTGTAQVADKGGYSITKYFHTFVGIAPISNPVFVMIVKLNSPHTAWAEESALPLWRNIAKFMLNYYQVPKTRAQ